MFLLKNIFTSQKEEKNQQKHNETMNKSARNLMGSERQLYWKIPSKTDVIDKALFCENGQINLHLKVKGHLTLSSHSLVNDKVWDDALWSV